MSFPPGRGGATANAGAAGSGASPEVPGLRARLRDIQSVADSALSALGPQEMLDALTDRVRRALHGDTAVVLLLDRPAGHLVATAASGLQEEVRQGVRVPVGRGFAGRIAQSGRPLILSPVQPGRVVNQLLIARGLSSLMGVPLWAAGEVIGVLHVGTVSPRSFTAEDVSLLQMAADRAAMAVQALNTQLDRSAAVALQRGLLPGVLPELPGLDMAARYVPGSGSVGGDWYDVFRLPEDGETCVVIGDVAGSGIRAAAIMGRARSALRAYALETADPADILGRLDRKIQYFEPSALATVLCVIISADLSQARVSCAGHLPPVLAGPGQAAALLEVAADPLIGVSPRGPRRTVTLALPPGSMLGLYTDGLVERRDRLLDEGLTTLCAAIACGPAEAACASLMSAMAPHSSRTDDITLLLLRRDP